MQLEIRNIIMQGLLQFNAEICEWLLETPESYDSFNDFVIKLHNHENDSPFDAIKNAQHHRDSIEAMAKNSRFLLACIPDDPPPMPTMRIIKGIITDDQED